MAARNVKKPKFRRWLYNPDEFPGQCFGCFEPATTVHPELNYPCCQSCTVHEDLFTRAVNKRKFCETSIRKLTCMEPVSYL